LELKKGYIQSLKIGAHHMRGVSYTILTLRNSCCVGYLQPSLETFHSTTTEKSIHLFTDVATHEVTWYVIEQKKMTQWNSCTTRPKEIFTMLLITKTFALSWNFVCNCKMTPPFFRWCIRKKFSSYIRVNTVFWHMS
jgi:hypothetical protein